jgi:hypothetical protein
MTGLRYCLTKYNFIAAYDLAIAKDFAAAQAIDPPPPDSAEMQKRAFLSDS